MFILSLSFLTIFIFAFVITHIILRKWTCAHTHTLTHSCVSSQQVVSGRSGWLPSFQLGAGSGLLGSPPMRVFVRKCQRIRTALGKKNESRSTAGNLYFFFFLIVATLLSLNAVRFEIKRHHNSSSLFLFFKVDILYIFGKTCFKLNLQMLKSYL